MVNGHFDVKYPVRRMAMAIADNPLNFYYLKDTSSNIILSSGFFFFKQISKVCMYFEFSVT